MKLTKALSVPAGGEREPSLTSAQARNAVNGNVTLGIGETLDYAEGQPQTRAVTITGAGDQAFCAGADLKEVAAGAGGLDDSRAERWGCAEFVQHATSKPIIAVVNGFALGGGAAISLASDPIVSADSATFGLPEVERGIFAAAGGAFRLPRRLPYEVALEAMLTAQPISAHHAYEFGLANRVVPLERLLAVAGEVATTPPAPSPTQPAREARLSSCRG